MFVMRLLSLLPVVFAILQGGTFVARAALVNGGFEECIQSAQAPNRAWTLRGGLLPAGWQFNAMYGGQVEIVADCHSGGRALCLAGAAAHLFHPPVPVKTGEILQVSAWAKKGSVELTFYEYAGGTFLRTVPSVATVTAGDEWTQGGGYHHVSDPRVTLVAVVLARSAPGSVLIDDVQMSALPFLETDGADVMLENRGCRLTIGAGGRTKEFFDKTLGKKRAAAGAVPFFSAVAGNWQLPATRVARKGDVLQLTFGDGRAHAAVEIQEQPYFLAFILKSWDPPDLARVTLFDLAIERLRTVGASAGIMYDDKAAVGLQTLHYAGSQEVLAADQTALFRCSFPGARGLDKAACAFLACPRPRLEQTIQEIETDYGLPSPRIEGVWGKQSHLMKRSYFFVHDLSESNVDEAIKWGKRGRFGYILVLEDAWSHGGGTFAVNRKNFPRGRDGLKSVVARLQAAGFKVGLHFLAAGMRGSDPMVSPVPSDGLYYAAEIPLASDLDAKADFLHTAVPPRAFPEKDGGYEGSGTYLRLDDEIIWYRTVKLDPPCGFAGCTRGALNSAPAAHTADARARHMMRAFNLFLIDADSPLLDRVAENFAAVFAYCGLDGLYLDGSECLQGDQNYYNARIQTAYDGKLGRRDIICQGSSYSSYTWHLMSRTASADGYRDVKACLDRRSPAFVSWYDANLMPLDIGWYGLNPQIRPDDIEYVCSRAVGFNASISLSTSLQNLETVPQAGDIVDGIARWEELRLSGKAPEAVRALLREPGKEYRLKVHGNETLLIPVEYSDWAEAGTTGKDAGALQLRNTRGTPAALELQLECDDRGWTGANAATNPAVRVGNSEIVFNTTMSPGDRLVCRGVGDCRLCRPGKTHEVIPFDRPLPPVNDSMTVVLPGNAHALRMRAAMSWPDLAVKIPRK